MEEHHMSKHSRTERRLLLLGPRVRGEFPAMGGVNVNLFRNAARTSRQAASSYDRRVCNLDAPLLPARLIWPSRIPGGVVEQFVVCDIPICRCGGEYLAEVRTRRAGGVLLGVRQREYQVRKTP